MALTLPTERQCQSGLTQLARPKSNVGLVPIIKMSRARPTSHENYFHLALWVDQHHLHCGPIGEVADGPGSLSSLFRLLLNATDASLSRLKLTR